MRQDAAHLLPLGGIASSEHTLLARQFFDARHKALPLGELVLQARQVIPLVEREGGWCAIAH